MNPKELSVIPLSHWLQWISCNPADVIRFCGEVRSESVVNRWGLARRLTLAWWWRPLPLHLLWAIPVRACWLQRDTRNRVFRRSLMKATCKVVSCRCMGESLCLDTFMWGHLREAPNMEAAEEHQRAFRSTRAIERQSYLGRSRAHLGGGTEGRGPPGRCVSLTRCRPSTV